MRNVQKYPAYKDSGVEWLGEIPEHWEVRPGFTIVEERNEKNLGLKEKVVLSLSYGKVKIKPEEKLTGLIPESFETYQLVYPGDIIIRPTDLQNDKTSLRTGLAKDKGIITSAYINLKVKKKNSTAYFHYFLHTVDITKVIYGLGTGLRQNLGYSEFKRFKFLAPPPSEQTAIAQFLDRKTTLIDQAIDIKQKQIELLKERRQILIHQAVTRGLNPEVKMKDSGVEWIGEVPEHWEVKRLKFIFENIQTGTTPSTNNQTFFDGIINWFNPRDLNNETLLKSEKTISQTAIDRKESKMFPGNSILIVGIGGTTGKTSYMINQGSFNQQITGFHSSSNLNKYYFYLLKSIAPMMLRVANYTTLPILNNEFFKSLVLIQPNLKEQLEIVQFIETMQKNYGTAITLKQQEIAKLQEYKATLINSAVTGKIKVGSHAQ